MSKIGYARVSSKEQNLDRQLQALESVSKVFSDKLSGATTERPQLKAMLDFIRDGDIVVVAELDRLGRNNKDLTEIMNVIQQKGATLEVLNLPSMNGISDDNLRRLINNLVIELYKYQAESERKRIKERQAQGIALAKEKGKFKGGQRKFKENDPRLKLAFDLFLSGKTDKEVEEQTGINRRTFRRYRERHNIYRIKK
ncbi:MULTISPECIES: recombinase family protein [Pseudolactococcus]|jgi:DNA invertase Pin-like site-specific DNA recombinase|uniref:Resolvase protein n=1 Tax=Pseudolactococcus piscium MKFS47 TaxID=297352 RepID=A0A0D6DZZ5_9LACT|nr:MULTISPECIES: recombinase family protein [Lactococcus]MBQ2637064.1 recombinase family protein [Methanobrevibacter sp.]MBQ4163951.1 recombinase family protein [Turicibacter sp.]MBQ9658425.1 recombinase family protein [Clostridia bacterium]MCJ1971164.1 recombinase family protein [Lactococcus carnosus]CEN29533.1 Resolvase protein [Lactococcus piscium MKFS47]